jgi:hypothetical protein
MILYPCFHHYHLISINTWISSCSWYFHFIPSYDTCILITVTWYSWTNILYFNSSHITMLTPSILDIFNHLYDVTSSSSKWYVLSLSISVLIMSIDIFITTLITIIKCQASSSNNLFSQPYFYQLQAHSCWSSIFVNLTCKLTTSNKRLVPTCIVIYH